MSKITNSDLLQDNGITALSFSKNGMYCAIGTKKNTSVYLFQIKTFNDINTWNILQIFTDHHQTVSDIDWSVDEKILTVSHDRSVYVWKKNNNKWQKMLANIDVRLSILACKWAPSCKKFALAACPTSLIVGYYNIEGACWTGLVKDKIVNVPIISVDFHPSCNLIAIGSVDGSVKIVSSSFKSQTDKYVIQSKVDDYPYSGPFEKINSFGQVLFSIDNILTNMKIWINHVSFENNGKNLLVLTHSNHNKFYDVVEGQKILINQRDISHKTLPFANGLFSPQKQQLILAGFDRKVSVFSKNGDSFKFQRTLDRNEKSNKLKSHGVVTSMLKGIQKKDWSFGDHPKQDQHSNTVKVVKTRGSYVSYDLNGFIHFWE